MIRINRRQVPEPASLHSHFARMRRKAAGDFFGQPETRRPQQRFDFSLGFAQPGLRMALDRLFAGKCAYCEQPVNGDRKEAIDRFRPPSGAIGIDGTVARDGYWWLAFDWSNMYLCCAQCNRAKSIVFPVIGKRLEPGAPVRLEKPLLLDPCSDDPATHLHFSPAGRVAGKTTRGKATVDILRLNRPELVAQRRDAATLFISSLEGLLKKSVQPLTIRVDRGAPFAGMKEQFVREAHAQLRPNTASLEAGQLKFEREERAARRDEDDERRKRTRTQFLRKVVLTNIGAHKSFSMTFGNAETAGAPWMVVLGENGVGKSTLLKAIGFALAGQQSWSALGPHAGAVLPRNRDGVGTISLFFTDGETIRLKIDRGRKQVTRVAGQSRFSVVGFGATRLLPTLDHRSPEESEKVRLVNLFDPFTPLGDSAKWLDQLAPLQFEWAARTLRALLGIESDPEQVLKRGRFGSAKQRQVVLERHGVAYPIDSLSDGYQTIIGVACDIMAVLLERDLPVEHAQGLVLIDEIGNHLHPRWRMRIVKALKAAFPRVQFIVTTHEPLCLRGLVSGEVAVLREGERGKLFALEDLPEVKGMTVDQLLSSQYFGLHSTIDPDFEGEVAEYYALLSKKDRAPEENDRLQALEEIMSRTRLVGSTPREQILLKAIDGYLATAEAQHEPVDPTRLPPEVRESLVDLLKDAPPGGAA